MAEIKPKQRRPGRPKQSEQDVSTREDILDAALRTFAEQGYEGTSMRVLAASLGISHGLIPARFGTKDQLWRAAVDQGMERLWHKINATQREGSAVEKLHAAAVNMLISLWEYPAMLQLINQEGTRHSERLDYILQSQAQGEMHKRFQAIVDEGVREGVFREISSSLIFLMIAHGGGAALCLQPLSKEIGLLSSFNAKSCLDIANQVADIVVQGIRA